MMGEWRKDDGGVEKGCQEAEAQRQRPEPPRGTALWDGQTQINNSVLSTSGPQMALQLCEIH